ncbi:MAG: PTS sugar transporter subunit IIA [Gemmatimonadota bacterium]|jgi:mannitol/fructose-specific phosphotransferase system IIA component (Ntr-type)
MRLSEYLREDLVLHRLEARDVMGALEAFGKLFESGGHVPSRSDVVQALKDREASHTTCLGRGVAVPHATVHGLPEPLLLVASADPPVPFGPPESDPVDLFFVLLSPPGRSGEHIKLLARICRLAQHPEDLEEVRGAPDQKSLFDTVLRLDSRHV